MKAVSEDFVAGTLKDLPKHKPTNPISSLRSVLFFKDGYYFVLNVEEYITTLNDVLGIFWMTWHIYAFRSCMFVE